MYVKRVYKAFKAHELLFFLQNALPYVPYGLVAKNIYKVFCLASSIAWDSTLDEISEEEVNYLH
jgi:hypothetical protein